MKNEELIKALRCCIVDFNNIQSRLCNECPYKIYADGKMACENKVKRDAIDAFEAAEKRIAELEAQIPKHGDLIDRDVLKEQFVDNGQDIDTLDVIDIINNTPAVIEAERSERNKKMNNMPTVIEPIHINLNEFIKVKLTDSGKDIYYHRYDMINALAKKEVIKLKYPKEDENGYTKFQLWDFIALYGPHIGIAMPNVIQPLEIIYEGAR